MIPRGIKFCVELESDAARGYVCENYGPHFRLPELGPIGTNGLANARDFSTPVAAYEDRDGDFHIVAKFLGGLWEAEIDHSPLDIIAWHGTYAPYKYDLARFNGINTVTYDHPDPSIFCVLAAPSAIPGTSNVELGLIADRWSVARNTFRPPPFHRNVCSEFVGLIKGQYIGKKEGFEPGCASLHNCMSGHGPDGEAFAARGGRERAAAVLRKHDDGRVRDTARDSADEIRDGHRAPRARLLSALADSQEELRRGRSLAGSRSELAFRPIPMASKRVRER